MPTCLTTRRILPLFRILHDGGLMQDYPADAKADICEGRKSKLNLWGR